MKPRKSSILTLGWIRAISSFAMARSGKVDLACEQVAVNRSEAQIRRNDVQPEWTDNLVISGTNNYHVHSERASSSISGSSGCCTSAMNAFVKALAVATRPMY